MTDEWPWHCFEAAKAAGIDARPFYFPANSTKGDRNV